MIKSLQSLRFIFALLIFHHHFFINPQIDQFGTFPVAFFFILSGFVMAIGYADKVEDDSFSYIEFIKKRLIRIFPLNTICFALWFFLPFVLDLVKWHFSYMNYLLAIPDLLMVQAWIPIKEVYFSGNAVAWFLSDMLFCYLMFPLLVKILKSGYDISLMICILIMYLFTIQFIKGDSIHAFIYISPFFRIIDFLIGIFVCLKLKLSLIGILEFTN